MSRLVRIAGKQKQFLRLASGNPHRHGRVTELRQHTILPGRPISQRRAGLRWVDEGIVRWISLAQEQVQRPRRSKPRQRQRGNPRKVHVGHAIDILPNLQAGLIEPLKRILLQ